MIIKIVLLSVICIVYIIYSIRYSIQFCRSNYFTGGLKGFHMLMIWLIPFIWIILLKTLFKPIQGSYQFNNKKVQLPLSPKKNLEKTTKNVSLILC